MSKVDILIPAFNAAHFLPGAIESVLAQTEPDWRILLVDDGSTDDTRAVVEGIQADQGQRLAGRLTYIFQQNRGLPAARNAGIRAGSSPYLALLDADDLWVPERLQESLAALERQPEAGIAYGGVTRFRDANTMLDTFTTSNPGSTCEQTAHRLYTRAVSFPCPTVTFRRACVEAVGMFDESLRATEDRDLWLRIAQRYPVVFVPKVLALYRTSANSMSGDLPRMLAAQQQFIAKHAGTLGCGWAAQRTALAGALRDQAEGYLARGQARVARTFALRSLASAPWQSASWRTAAACFVRALRPSGTA